MVTKVPQILSVNILFFTISWLAVLLRVYVRGFLRPSWGTDDWLMLATQVLFPIYLQSRDRQNSLTYTPQAFYTAYLSCQLGGLANGTGRHIYDLELKHAQKALEFWFFCEIFYVISACLLKISVGFFLLRVTIKKQHIWILWTFIVGTGVLGTAYVLLTILQCYPTSGWWTIPERKGCINPHIIADATYAASSINAVADWVFGLLPIFIVKDLQMSKRMKTIVTGTSTDLALWSTVEVGVGVVAACFGTLRPLLRVIQVKTGRKPSSYKDSSHLPDAGPSGPYGRASSRNKPYRNGHDDNVSMDELRPDLPLHATVTTVTGRQDDYSPPSTSGRPRTRSLDQKNNVKVTLVLSDSQSGFPTSQAESLSKETKKEGFIHVDVDLKITYEDTHPKTV
ncbi:integral membrane protein [Rutstroemia sp. NJR-2017a BVV2]|nr:integral membrane protein [Rutstroemia sp. NJR-2017a BVV2]